MSEIAPEHRLEVDGMIYTKYIPHYYDDGNLILLAGDAAFRVFKSVMARRSMVFQDMMDFDKSPTHASAPQMMVDGVPAVVLHDSAEDIVLLLDHLLPPTSNTVSTQLTSIEIILRLLPLSKKYGAEDVTQVALKAVDKHLIRDKSLPTDLKLPAYSSTKSLVTVVNSCKAHDLPQYLPLVFYKLATWPMTPSDWVPLERLAAEDRMRIDLGRAALQKAVAKGVRDLANVRECQDCVRDRPSQWAEGDFWGELFEDPIWAINRFLGLMDISEWHMGFCSPKPPIGAEKDCSQDVQFDLMKLQEELLDSLAGFFRLAEDNAILTDG